MRLEGSGVGEPPAPFPDAPRAPALLRAGGVRRPTHVLRSFYRWPASVRSGSAPTTHQPSALHLGQRTPPLASRESHPGPCPARVALPLFPSFHSALLLSCIASPRLDILHSGAGQKLSSLPDLREVLLLFICVFPSRRELDTRTGLLLRAIACLAQSKTALGSRTWTPGRRLGSWTPAGSPPLWTRALLPRTRPLPDHPMSSPCMATATP